MRDHADDAHGIADVVVEGLAQRRLVLEQGLGEAGAVSVAYGSWAGLTTSGGRLFTQVAGSVEADDQFGAQLAAGDFNHNGFTDLAAAAPEETVGTLPAAGAVSVLYGSGGGLTTTGGQLFTQNSAGVPGTAERGDRFGGTAFPLP